MLLQEHQGHGFADDLAAPEDHGPFSLHGHAIGLEHVHHGLGGAGAQPLLALKEQTLVHGMEPVHVLRGINVPEDALGVHGFGQRQLHEDAIYLRILIEPSDGFDELRGRTVRRQKMFQGLDARACAGCDLVPDVDLAGGILADQHYGEAGGSQTRGFPGFHGAADKLQHPVRMGFPIENLRHLISA